MINAKIKDIRDPKVQKECAEYLKGLEEIKRLKPIWCRCELIENNK